MAKVSIRRALKEKAKLVGELSVWNSRLARANTRKEGEPEPDYSAQHCFEKVEDLHVRIAKLKALIHTANSPVHETLFILSEKKAFAKTLTTLNSNKEDNSFFRRRELNAPPIVEHFMPDSKYDKLSADLNAEIERMYAELDDFNNHMYIEVYWL
jgi:superoxide dismutase